MGTGIEFKASPIWLDPPFQLSFFKIYFIYYYF